MTGGTTVRPATDAEIEAILGWTHGIWGVELPFEAYLARTRGFLATPWGQARYRFQIAHDEAGEPVSACKLYRLEAELRGEAVEAIGFGAVVTPPAHRGRGHAGRMLAALMADARADGVATALLFSDIGPALYAALGFEALTVQEGKAEALPGPAPFAPWPPAEAVPAAWHAPSPFRLRRTPAYAAYALARVEGEPLAWRPGGPDAPPRGFAVIRVEDDEVWIDDAGHAPGEDATAFWTDLRRLAGARGMPHAAGWLPAEAAPAGFALAPLTAPLPMAAPLAAPAPASACHLWSIDHF